MGSISRNRLLVFCVAVALFGAACGGSSSPPATATAVATATTIVEAAPSATPSLAPTTVSSETEPDGNRILEDVRTLSVGPRSSATEKELTAANEIADRLRGLGYEVTIQEFGVGSQAGRSSELRLTSPVQRTIATLPLGGSPTATVTGRIVAVPGAGEPGDFPDDVSGAIALIKRGTLLFEDKVNNAQAAGAAGVIIYNNEDGTFLGGADNGVGIPAVTISQVEGVDLVATLQSVDVEATLSIGNISDATSQNIIAKAPGAECETISGGHYDSVPQAPGASDNATGTSTVLEIAKLMMENGGAGNNCFVLFGAEELGLLGSRYFVSTLDQDAKDHIKAMLNFDMVGVGDDTWWLIGTPDLQQRMGQIATNLGIDTVASSLTGTTSDQASFLEAGIPALMFHRWQDPLLHTPQDVIDRVRPELLEQAARMGLAMLEALGAEG
jgi:aminopeptidase YwaD